MIVIIFDILYVQKINGKFSEVTPRTAKNAFTPFLFISVLAQSL
jgi:hypothetical protein